MSCAARMEREGPMSLAYKSPKFTEGSFRLLNSSMPDFAIAS